ncbi:Zinc-regulated transporter 1 [Golovinomyces cichoracearum]|uniref:Zinc-regulated transporter 1 n=1 Tax=Golovinomyces cichoracearum TaxID=62708 RepID=A0A420I773_9PEZI|nr:Zinc-regulated transporter 1 [Golovinomyces cichoracearum]
MMNLTRFLRLSTGVCYLLSGQVSALRENALGPALSDAGASSGSRPMLTQTSLLSRHLSSSTGDESTTLEACHMHGSAQYCVDAEGHEVKVVTAGRTSPSYSGCHMHGGKRYCFSPDGQEVEILSLEQNSADPLHVKSEEKSKEHSKGKKNCHYHAGVEHCVYENASETSEKDCGRKNQNYNVNLRIGLLLVVLVTSAIGVFTPILLTKFLNIKPNGMVITFIKQFGTGIIIATAFIHLLTHAELMFANPCLGQLKYESTATSIAMAGAFIAFLVDYISHRLAQWHRAKASSEIIESEKDLPNDSSKDVYVKASAIIPEALNLTSCSHHNSGNVTVGLTNHWVSLLILEAGIIFHSLLIGITLVVAGDSVFITLFIVIIFHQMFEGLALGARIAAVNNGRFSNAKTILLPLAFSFVTPLGMAIGIGVIQSFNGNDTATIIVLGTLDSLSAGILIWVGIIDMWAGDWIYGDLANASLSRTVVGMISLISGFALMGLLGKWA